MPLQSSYGRVPVVIDSTRLRKIEYAAHRLHWQVRRTADNHLLFLPPNGSGILVGSKPGRDAFAALEKAGLGIHKKGGMKRKQGSD